MTFCLWRCLYKKLLLRSPENGCTSSWSLRMPTDKNMMEVSRSMDRLDTSLSMMSKPCFLLVSSLRTESRERQLSETESMLKFFGSSEVETRSRVSIKCFPNSWIGLVESLAPWESFSSIMRKLSDNSLKCSTIRDAESCWSSALSLFHSWQILNISPADFITLALSFARSQLPAMFPWILECYSNAHVLSGNSTYSWLWQLPR